MVNNNVKLDRIDYINYVLLITAVSSLVTNLLIFTYICCHNTILVIIMFS